MSAEMLDCPALGCKEEFVGTIARNLHVRREHPGLDPEPAPIEDPAFAEDGRLQEGMIGCADCDETFATARGLAIHRGRKHPVQPDGSDSPPSPDEEPKSEPAAEPEPEPDPEPEQILDEPTENEVREAADRLSLAARTFVGIISAYQFSGSGDSDEIEFAMWRLGAAIADYEDLQT